MPNRCICPLIRPSTSMTNGSVVPPRASRCIQRTYCPKLIRVGMPSGAVGSHGPTQSMFSRRSRSHSRRSRRTERAQRKGGGEAVPRGEGHGPGRRRHVTPRRSQGRFSSPPRELVERVRQNPFQQPERVGDSPPRAGQVDHQRAPGDAGQAARQHRGRDAVRQAGRADRIGYAGQQTLQVRLGLLRGDIGRGDARAPGGDDHGRGAARAVPSALPTGGPSWTTRGPVTAYPQSLSRWATTGPVRSS